MKEVEEKLQNSPGDISLQSQEYALQKQLIKWLYFQEACAQQKSRQHWLTLGDRSTKFFHNYCNYRISQNNIPSLLSSDGNLITYPHNIVAAAPKYFENLFCNKD